MDPTLAFVSSAFGAPRGRGRAFVTGARPVKPTVVRPRPAALVVRATAAGEAPPTGSAPESSAASSPKTPAEASATSKIDLLPTETPDETANTPEAEIAPQPVAEPAAKADPKEEAQVVPEAKGDAIAESAAEAEPVREEVKVVADAQTVKEAVAEPVAEPVAIASESIPEDTAKQPVAVDAPASSDAAATDAGDDALKAGGERRRRNRRVGGRQKREVTLKLEDMTVGQELEGTVRSTTSYGAFIGDMGTPTDGLLHVSQLASGYVENVTDVVNVGDKVTVRILSVDLEKGNFSLTMKPPRTPEQEAADAERRSEGGSRSGRGGGASNAAKWKSFTYDPEVFVDVKVVSVAGFGAFCKLLDAEGNEDESVPTDGLIHISELSDDHVDDVSSVLSVGQVVKARVTETDRKRNRISLSLKQHRPTESESFEEDMKANRSKQPEFKTTMELAFERARKKQ